MYQVYVLMNHAGRRYIGLSENPEIRVAQHNSGVSKWTKGKGPWKVIWTSRGMNLGEARKLETRLKKQKGGKGLALLIEELGTGS
jgi:putative endonuclease